MKPHVFPIEQMGSAFSTGQDWLFESLLGNLNRFRNLLLMADQGWGIKDYVNELGFQLAEKNPEIHTCFIDMRPAHCPDSFLELFTHSFFLRFPEESSFLKINNSNLDPLKLPQFIARRNKIKIGVFLGNIHLFKRFRDPVPFLRAMNLKLKSQKDCVFCLYGTKTPYLNDLLRYPGPLSGLGRLYELRSHPFKYRSAGIRKLFHDHNKKIGLTTSRHMSSAMDNHPFYLKLLAWHALILTDDICTEAIADKALNNLLLQYDFHFHEVADRLTAKQLNFLKALIKGNQNMFSNSTRIEYQLGPSSTVARIKSSLEKKEIIHCSRIGIDFTSPVFREWLRRRYF